MTQPAEESEDAALRRRRGRAIAAVVAAAATFAVAAALVKWVAPAIPTIQIVFFRSVVSLIALSPMIRREGGLKVLATRRPGWHVLRTLAGFGGMFTAFYGYATLPLAEVTALGFTMPLFLTALSIPLLGEKVGIRRWSAVIVGFLGVLLILRPGAGAVPLGPAAWRSSPVATPSTASVAISSCPNASLPTAPSMVTRCAGPLAL
ncbi:MAG: DMT family transporter, partial [Elioraea tepidiphila]